MAAQASHPTAGTVQGEVLDASLGGLRIRTASLHSTELSTLPGSCLDSVTVRCGDAIVYEGTGTVVRYSKTDEGVDLGVRLDATGLDVASIERVAYQSSLLERWQRFESEAPTADAVTPQFRAWVADLSGFLERASRFLQAEEAPLQDLDAMAHAQALSSLQDSVGREIVERMNRAGEELWPFVAELSSAGHTNHRRYLQLHIGRYLRVSPFLRRAYEKPLGYAGDYEMMNMLYRDHAEGDTTLARALNVYGTGLRVAQANINRIDYFQERISEAVTRTTSSRRTRVVSLGCGPGFEILNLLQTQPDLGHRLEAVLIDQEDRAIAHCERTLAGPAMRSNAVVHVVKDSVRRLLSPERARAMLGQCDLIYSAGLFDYLQDRAFGALLGSLYGCLVENGRLIVGNVAADNPDRWAMEYFTEWFLHHRAPPELLEQAATLQPPPQEAVVGHEPTGVNLFLTVTRS